jgi:hypothetical protein
MSRGRGRSGVYKVCCRPKRVRCFVYFHIKQVTLDGTILYIKTTKIGYL